jgi:hypothetical protein
VISSSPIFKSSNVSRRKKPRGVKRKASQILTKSRQFNRVLDEEDEFNYCHWHLDWDGIGDFSPEIRLITLEAHLQVFGVLAKTAADMRKPFQLFLSLAREDAGQDAVYMHTPNEYTDFPADFDDVAWGLPELEALLSKILPNYEFKAGRREFNYVAYAVGLGTPLSVSAHA